MASTESLLDETDAAQYIAMSAAFLQASRIQPKASGKLRSAGPPFIKLGRSVRYLRADLDRWLAERRVARTAPPVKRRRTSRAVATV
jgi:predicted DNA-binding transcriptional regulator AlpA